MEQRWIMRRSYGLRRIICTAIWIYTRLSSDPLADTEQQDEYLAENVLCAPKETRWSFFEANAKQLGMII